MLNENRKRWYPGFAARTAHGRRTRVISEAISISRFPE
jgi:hypothetical protein